MTNKQTNIVIGSLLGDGYLTMHGRSKNSMFKFKQSSSRKEYVDYIYDSLGSYVSCGVREAKARKPSRVNGKISHKVENWNGEYCYSSYFWSKAHEDFTDLWKDWYDKIKIIPQNLKLNAEVLAHWYMQDGSNNIGNQSKGISFATHSFSEKEVDFLISLLDKEFKLEAKRYAGPALYIMSGSYFDFIDIVKPYVSLFDCFDYKIDTEGAPADRKGEKWHGPKLSYKIAQKIRALKASKGMKLKELAEKFNTTVSTIGKIVNNQMYVVEHSFKFGGSAIVRIGYNAN